MYELRQPANYSFGTLGNAAALSDTSLVSADFVAQLVSGLSTSVYVPITLQDPTNKVYEIVWVTAHTAGSNSATVVRGREGTTARAWPASTLWTCAPTLRDGVLPVSTASALPTDPHIGLRCLVQDTKQVVAWNGSAWTGTDSVTQYATADTTVNNSTASVNVPGLAVPVAANAMYAFEGFVYYLSNTTANLKLGIALPSGATGYAAAWGPVLNQASRLATIDTGVLAIPTTVALSGDNVASPIGPSARPSGYFTTGSNSGNLQLTAAQSTANASNTVLKAGSWLRATRVA